MAKDWEYHKKMWINVFQTFAEKYLFLKIEEESQSPIEQIAALKLRHLENMFGQKNIIITAQKKIGKYRVDFELIHKPYFLLETDGPLHKIIVECDGHEFHEKTKEQASRDKARDRYMTKLGYQILRYTGTDIMRDPLLMVSDIEEIMDPQMQEKYKTE